MLALSAAPLAVGRCVTTRRTQFQLLLHLVGILMAADDDGLPLPMLARALYSPGSLSGKRARNATLRLVESAGGALPVWQDTRGERLYVGINRDMLPSWLAKYGIGENAP